MLSLDTKITLDEETIRSPNLVSLFSDDDLSRIGNFVHTGYSLDRTSREKWEKRTQAALDLALQVVKAKTFPWPNCSNVAFPLITISALQFHSRAYPTLISGPNIVKCQIYGPDPSGEKAARARRISDYMSWQYLEQDTCWESEHDRLLLVLPIVGTAFIKTYYDADKDYRVGELVLPQDLVLNYWAKSVESCPRKTHILYLSRNDIHSRIKRGVFRDISNLSWYNRPAPQPDRTLSDEKADKRIGLLEPPTTDESTPFVCLEQHVDVDLDQDGYAEPYIITIEESSKTVLRIVTGFDRPEDIDRTKDGDIICVRRMEYFTKYGFIPSPDGGIYDIGFGTLLGPLNESVNTLINQLIDSGTMAATGGGFLGRGIKVRGGNYAFMPQEWKRTEASGDELQKGIFPLPIREPSSTLYNLLVLLINYVNRIAGTTDPLVGESPGQNTTAEATRTMVEQGMKIYNAIFKRVWRCLKEEFKRGYILNGIYLPPRSSYSNSGIAMREDYLHNPDEVCPAADPNMVSDTMAFNQAQALKAAAATTPGYNIEEVERRFLRALKVDSIETVYPGIKATGTPKDSRVQIAEIKAQVEMAKMQSEQARWAAEMQEEIRMNNAEIAKIAADIENMRATTAGDVADRQVAILNAVLGILKSRNDVLLKKLDTVVKLMEVRNVAKDNRGDVQGLAATPSDRGPAGGNPAEPPGGVA